MGDKLKDLIEKLPQEKAPDLGDQTVWQIVRNEILRLWERRISLVSAVLSLLLGYLAIKQVRVLIEYLDTVDFWILVRDQSWRWDEGFLSAVLEANPLKEIVSLFLLLILLFLNVKILFREKRKHYSMKKRNVVIAIIVFLILVTGLVAIWVFGSYRKTMVAIQLTEGSQATPTIVQLSPTISSGTPFETQTPTPTSKDQLKVAFFLEILAPEDGATVKVPHIEVKGRTSLGSEVFVNEDQVYPDQNGNFWKTVTLQEGENYIVVAAGNELSDSEVERIVYYEK